MRSPRPPASHDDDGVSWLAELWWLSSRRQWRQHGGAVLLASGVSLLLVLAVRSAPAGGEQYYLGLVLLLVTTSIVAAPLILSMESVVVSRRLDLLPLAVGVRWLARLLLSNTFRTLLSILVFVWGVLVVVVHGPDDWRLPARLLQLLGIVLASLALSQFIEDVIRHSRAVVFHQLVFLIVLSFWPVMLDYLRTSSNFVPPPPWTEPPLVAALLVPGPAPALPLAIATVIPFLLAAALFRADVSFLAHYQNRPTQPPSSVRWTAAIARVLGGREAEGSALGKELVVPLRFLFLRMTLVFLVLSAMGGFMLGAPFLLLTAPFWWQPLSTNGLGPDLEDAKIRYHLLGMPLGRVLRWRLAASVVLTAAAFALTGLIAAATGLLESPHTGPPDRAMYVVAMLYALSLLPFWAIAGDRYSIRFPDRLEMHTLLPERTRSGGAAAVLTLFFMWVGLLIGATLLVLAAAGVVFMLFPGPLNTARAAIVALLASTANVSGYLLHTRFFADRGS